MRIELDGRKKISPPVAGRRFLIVADADDLHAGAIADRLAAAGHVCSRWSAEDVFRPGAVTLSCGIDRRPADEGFDLAWIRKVVMPRDRFPETSFEFREDRAAGESILLSLELECRTINRYSSILRAQHKVLQLRCAAAAGANVPATVVTQDPQAVRDLWSHTRGRLVYKPLTSSRYVKDGAVRVLPTTRLSAAHLEDDALISTSFGIYQEEITRDCEARITIFGNQVFAAIAQADPGDLDMVDWRILFAEQRFNIGSVPEEIITQCRAVMRSLRLDYGAFDFVRRQDGRWFFLEVNDAGNFMFLQSLADSIADAFAEYLILEAGANERPIHKKTSCKTPQPSPAPVDLGENL